MAAASQMAGSDTAAPAPASLETGGTPAHESMLATPTPEVARLSDRAIAAVIDLAVVGGVFVVFGNWAGERWGGATTSGFELHGMPAAITILLTTLFGCAYYWVLEGMWGTTIGKSVLKLAVRGVNGNRIGLRRSFTRNAMRLVDGIGVYLVGWVAALCSKRRQRLGDHLAHTVVVSVGESPARLIGAVGLAAWTVVVVGGVLSVRRHAGPPREGSAVSTGEATHAVGSSTGGSVAPVAVSTGGSALVLSNVVWSNQVDGQPRSTPFRPGDNVFGNYEVNGFKRGPDGQVDVSIRVTPTDPGGVGMVDAIASDVRVAHADNGPIRGHFQVFLPAYVRPGNYTIRLVVHDAVGGGDATFGPTFSVEAPPLAPAGALEVRDAAFSSTDGGDAMTHPEFHAGDALFVTAKLSGIQFRNDSIDVQIGLALLDSSGKALLSNDHWGSAEARFTYHPPTFFLPAKANMSLPSPTPPGSYAVRFTLTDNVAATTVTYDAHFDVVR
jgi:uncharacterized RDD family membrane protein YckC